MTHKVIVYSFAACSAIVLAAFLFSQWQARLIADANPPKGSFVSVAGARMHYTDINPEGSRGTIVLVHGASGNEADMRLPLGQRLAARGYRVISADRPGHGWSTRDDPHSSPAVQARQIRLTLETLGVKRFVIVGHSLAGALTLQLALDHSDRVSAAVLLAPLTHPWPGGVAAYYNLIATPIVGPAFANTFMMPAALSVFDNSLRNVFAPQSPPEGYRQQTGVDLVLRPPTFRSNALDVAGVREFVVQEHKRYGSITIPVSIITGDSDTIVLTHIHSYGSKRDIPGSELHVLPATGHSPHWADPDKVSTLIADFADRTAAKGEARR